MKEYIRIIEHYADKGYTVEITCIKNATSAGGYGWMAKAYTRDEDTTKNTVFAMSFEAVIYKLYAQLRLDHG